MIVCAGLSPSWQQVYAFDALRPGKVNRAGRAIQRPSGKVLNAAIAVHRLGGPVRVITMVGGPLGRAIEESLESEGIETALVPVASPSRLCTTVIDRAASTITELVENAPPITPEEFEAYLEAYRPAVEDAEMVVLLGSLPPGAPPDAYRQLIEVTSAPVIADFRGPALLEILPLGPAVVKPNREELALTLGRSLDDDDALRDALVEVGSLGARWTLVSDGAHALWAHGEGSLHVLHPPEITEVNPIGSGDTLSAALGLALARGDDFIEALRFATGAATANAATLDMIDIDPASAEELAARVRVERLG